MALSHVASSTYAVTYWREFWSCCLCAYLNTRDQTDVPVSGTDREDDPCSKCGSVWRQRAVALGVLHGLRSVAGPLSHRSLDLSIRGLGISDDHVLASQLTSAFYYTNSSLTDWPILDLNQPSSSLRASFDFVTCSDVLEHVWPDPQRALEQLRSLLKARGFAVITVPVNTEKTVSHYPGLHEWHFDGQAVQWTDDRGRAHVNDEPIFHGGFGETLEMVSWKDTDFERLVVESGFTSVQPVPIVPSLGITAVPHHGCYIASQ